MSNINRRITSLYDIEVELINKEEVAKFVKNHGEFTCICYNTPVKYAENVGKKVLASGHLSGSRADYFKFRMRLVPRSCADQTFRSDVGVAKNMQSLRYVSKGDFTMMFPDEVRDEPELFELWLDLLDETTKVYNRTIDILSSKYNLKGEKAQEIARGILPMDINTEFNIAFTLEALINFFNKRLCMCAQKPIRYMARLMRQEVLAVAPIYEPYFVPVCKRLLYCPEDSKRNCGLTPTKDVVLAKINK